MIAPFLFQNPEFIKNTRLEFSTTRLAVAMGLLALISWIPWNGAESIHQATNSLFSALSTTGFLFSIIWGSYLVANGLIEEEKQKTWDFVRLSSLSPAKILIGKIFGSPCLAWVVTLTGIFPLMIFSLAALFTEQVNLPRPEMGLILVFILCLAVWILLSYAFSFLLSIRALSLGRGNQRSVVGITILTFIFGSIIGKTLTFSLPSFSRPFCLPGNNCFPRTTWFGVEMLTLENALMALTFSCFWIVIGAYRSLRQALQFEDSPIAWIGFLVATTIFLSGYAPWTDINVWGIDIFLLPFLFYGIFTLLTCISEASDVVKYKRFAHNLTQKNYAEAFRHAPLWGVSFIGSIILSLFVSFYDQGTGFLFISVCLFLLRDLMVIHLIFWMPKIKRPALGILVYFALIYVLVPLFFDSLHVELYPRVKPDTRNMFLLAVQTGILAFFLAGRWNIVFSKDFYSLKSVENKAN